MIAKWYLSELSVLAFWPLSGSVFGLLTAPGLIVLHLKKKKSQAVLLVSPDPAGRGGLSSVVFLPCGSGRMGARFGLQYSQVPSFWPTPSELSAAHTVHFAYMHTGQCLQSTSLSPLWSVHEVHWVGANHTCPPPFLLAWVLRVSKVPSGQFSCPIELSLSGHFYLSELLLPPFDQSVRYPE